LGVISLKGRNWAFSGFLAAYVIAYVSLKLFGGKLLAQSGLLANFHLLTLPFVIGMAFYQFRRLLPLSIFLLAALSIVTVLTYGGFWFREVFVVCLCYSIFYVGYLRLAPLRAYNNLGDYSYGMYIYAFPCEQMVATLWKDISPLMLISISFPATLVAAMLSSAVRMPIVLHFKHMRPGGNREGAARPYDLLVAHWQFSHTTNLMADPVRGSLARRVPTAHARHPTAQYISSSPR
jgi:peptidoglycan/LPS O-acetylase OafA/YrhL